MKKLIFNIYYWLMFIITTVLFFILIPLSVLAGTVFLGKTADAVVRQGIVTYGWVLVKVLPFLRPVKVESRTGELPLPVIFVANHNSSVDPFLFGALLIDACFISTWPFKIPGYGFFMRWAGYINANEGWDKVCSKSIAALRSGTSLIIWPEGHRSRDGRLGRFKNGAFAIAAKTGYPLLPVCILGSRKFLPPGTKGILSPSSIKMILLDPIYPDMQNDQEQEIIKLRKNVQDVIRKTLQEEEDNAGLDPIPYLKGFERGEKC
jgi:1-acyl-sn-glycerol-3-phosphate acyltransferase